MTSPKRLRVHCPGCGDSQVPGDGQEIFRCQKCGGMFDGDPDEGSDYSDRDPSRRILRDEAIQAAQAKRRAAHNANAQTQRGASVRRWARRGG